MAADQSHPGPKQPESQPIFDAEQQARLQELSRKLLDLWQDHLSALAQDPTLMAQALKLMTAAAPFAWMPGYPMQYPPQGFGAGFGMPAAAEGGAGIAQPASPFPFQWPIPAASSAGAASAAAASGPGPGDVEQLRARLAELEGRLARLEGAAESPGTKPLGAKPGKPRRGAAKS